MIGWDWRHFNQKGKCRVCIQIIKQWNWCFHHTECIFVILGPIMGFIWVYYLQNLSVLCFGLRLYSRWFRYCLLWFQWHSRLWLKCCLLCFRLPSQGLSHFSPCPFISLPSIEWFFHIPQSHCQDSYQPHLYYISSQPHYYLIFPP